MRRVITWRELKELVEKEARGRDVEEFCVLLDECFNSCRHSRV